LASKNLDHQQETSEATWTPLPAHDGNLLDQVEFNHLDAYLAQLGILGGGLQFSELFNPM
jgi:hypothetical protein